MAQPQPGELNESGSQSRITGLGDALLAIDRSALPGRRRESGVRGNLASIVEMAEEPLQPEDGGKFRTDAFEVEQHPPGRRRRSGLLRGEHLVSLGLRQLDLIEQQFQPIEFAADLGLEMRRQGATVSRRQFIETLASIAAQRLVIGYSLGEQQSLDAIDVLDPLGDQHFAFAAKTTTVLFLRRRRLDHGADPGFATLMGQQGAKQRLAVDPVGLSSTAPARRRNRGRIDDVTLDSFLLQRAMKPEAVQPRFLNRDDWKGLARPRQSPLLQFQKPREQR